MGDNVATHREHGTVKWFKTGGGFNYGFIEPDYGGKDLFLHIGALRDPGLIPTKGDRVEYIPRSQDGKLRAADVVIVNQEEPSE